METIGGERLHNILYGDNCSVAAAFSAVRLFSVKIRSLKLNLSRDTGK